MKTKIMQLMLMLGAVAFVCSACGSTSSKTPGKNANIVPTKWEKPISQSPARQAEHIIKKKKGVTEVHAVNSKKDLMVAMKLKTFYRLSSQQMVDKFQKSLEKRFPDLKVQVSSDRKIFMEISSLQKQLKQGKVGSQGLDSKMKRIDKFMKEQDPSKQ